MHLATHTADLDRISPQIKVSGASHISILGLASLQFLNVVPPCIQHIMHNAVGAVGTNWPQTVLWKLTLATKMS